MVKRIDLIRSGGFIAGVNLAVAEVSDPIPIEGTEVVIDVYASAVNPVDWKMAEYGFFVPSKLPAAAAASRSSFEQEHSSLLVGKRVVTYLGANKIPNPTDRGAYVEKVVADANCVFEIPTEMTFSMAASMPVGGLTAELLLQNVASSLSSGGDQVRDDNGDGLVLIWGASSSVGFHAVQLASKRGWEVIAVASGKHERLTRDIGAAHFVDYRKDDVSFKVKDICNGRRLNGAIDCIGSDETHTTCMKLLSSLGDETKVEKVIGTVTVVGLPDPVTKGVIFKPVNLGNLLESQDGVEFIKEAFPKVLALQPQKIREIKGTFNAETVQEAFEVNKKGVSGEKVVIKWTK